MGTTQRIIPGVTGESNWGNLTSSITSLAKTIEKEILLNNDLQTETDQDKVNSTSNIKSETALMSKQQQRLNSRRVYHFQSALRNLILTGGGRTNITSGKSRSIGKAGIRSSKRLSGFITTVYNEGLENALRSIGLNNLKGKSFQEVLDFLLIHFTDLNAGMDEVAANIASCEIIELLAGGLLSVEELEAKLKSLVEDNSLTDLLCHFFGIYLFEHLSQRFQEKITQLKGDAVSKETFKIIKEDILDQIKLYNSKKNLSEVNWKGKEGKEIEEKIFDSIIQIFE